MLELDDEQKEVIRPIVDKYAKENFELMKSFRGEFILLINDFRNELKPHLTNEQIRRLKEFGERGKELRRKKEFPRHKRRRSGHGPGGDPDPDPGPGGPPQFHFW